MLSEANGNLEFASQTCTFRGGSRVAAMSAMEVYEGQSTVTKSKWRWMADVTEIGILSIILSFKLITS